jgi:hypothetical protein
MNIGLDSLAFRDMMPLIARCVFVRHALSRTCRTFRACFRDEGFLAVMQYLSTIIRLTPMFDFEKMCCILFPHPTSIHNRITRRLPWSEIGTKDGFECHFHGFRERRFEFALWYSHQHFSESWLGRISTEVILSRVCSVFGCKCEDAGFYFESIRWYIEYDAIRKIIIVRK